MFLRQGFPEGDSGQSELSSSLSPSPTIPLLPLKGQSLNPASRRREVSGHGEWQFPRSPCYRAAFPSALGGSGQSSLWGWVSGSPCTIGRCTQVE